MSYTFTAPFDTESNYDLDGTEIIDSKSRPEYLKSTPGSIFMANYKTNKDANWASVDVTGTLKGSASVSGEKLDCTGGLLDCVEYDAANISALQNEGTIELGLIANFDGLPGSNREIFSISKNAADQSNLIRLTVGPTGLSVLFYDETITSIYSAVINSDARVKDQLFVVTIDFKLTGNAATSYINCFLDYVRQTDAEPPWQRGSDQNKFIVGANRNSGNGWDGYIDWINVYDTVQHNKTATSYADNGEPYDKVPALAKTLVKEEKSVQSVMDFDATVTEPANTAVKFYFIKNGIPTYHDGSTWTTSNEIDQFNTVGEIKAAKDTLISSNSSLKVKVAHTTTDDTVRSEIDSLTLTYDYGGSEKDVTRCDVYGYYKNLAGERLNGATVRFKVEKINKEYVEANSNIIYTIYETTTGPSTNNPNHADGYFEAPLIRSSQMNNANYYIEIEYNGEVTTQLDSTGNLLTFSVPDSENLDITTLLG